jgi:hypothetical protein
VDSIAKAENVGIDVNQSSGGGAAVRGVLVGMRPNADASVQRAASSFIRILQETVGKGVSLWDFDKLIGAGGMVMFQHIGKPATPNEKPPLKIYIGSKQ